MEEVHVYVSGIVQGVGFRFTVLKHAELYNIKGYVQNLNDGRVEICAQGKPEKLHSFLHIIKNHPGSATISAMESKAKPIHISYESFEMR